MDYLQLLEFPAVSQILKERGLLLRFKPHPILFFMNKICLNQVLKILIECISPFSVQKSSCDGASMEQPVASELTDEVTSTLKHPQQESTNGGHVNTVLERDICFNGNMDMDQVKTQDDSFNNKKNSEQVNENSVSSSYMDDEQASSRGVQVKSEDNSVDMKHITCEESHHQLHCDAHVKEHNGCLKSNQSPKSDRERLEFEDSVNGSCQNGDVNTNSEDDFSSREGLDVIREHQDGHTSVIELNSVSEETKSAHHEVSSNSDADSGVASRAGDSSEHLEEDTMNMSMDKFDQTKDALDRDHDKDKENVTGFSAVDTNQTSKNMDNSQDKHSNIAPIASPDLTPVKFDSENHTESADVEPNKCVQTKLQFSDPETNLTCEPPSTQPSLSRGNSSEDKTQGVNGFDNETKTDTTTKLISVKDKLKARRQKSRSPRPMSPSQPKHVKKSDVPTIQVTNGEQQPREEQDLKEENDLATQLSQVGTSN